MWGGVLGEQIILITRCQKIRAELGIPLDATVLLSVGEVNVNKNHKAVIEAMPGECWYVVCGRGPLVEEHKRLAESLGVGNRVIFTGYRTDVSDFYKMADIFVFPSLREGLPVALMEAMAAGLPCVASHNRGSNDLLAGSELLFEATEVEELRKKLVIAMNNDCSAEIERNKKHLAEYDIGNALAMVRAIYVSQG